MGVTIYHNPKCAKSRATLALLRERGIEPTIVEYLKTPLSAADISRLLKKMGLRARDIVRAKYARDAGIGVEALGDDALIAKIAANPTLLERPIVVKGNRAALGLPPENVLAIL